jgi:hypothetical protein
LAFYKILIRIPASSKLFPIFTNTYEHINHFSDPASIMGCIVYKMEGNVEHAYGYLCSLGVLSVITLAEINPA